MGIKELRQWQGQNFGAGAVTQAAAEDLLCAGAISKADLLRAQMVQRRCDASLDRILSAEGLACEEELLETHARRHKTHRLGAAELARTMPADTGIDPREMLRHGFAPMRDAQGHPVVVAHDLEALTTVDRGLPAEFSDAPRVLATRAQIQARVADAYRAFLTRAAQARVPAIESCRHWGARMTQRMALTLLGLVLLGMLTLAFPTEVFGAFMLWAVFTLVVSGALKTAAFVASLSAEEAREATQPASKDPLPKVSILVPLFRETEILHALIARLTRLTYPKCLLDVVLVLEEEDDTTQETLAGIDLPPWIRAVVVPDGTPRTKPRAMNYALDFCEGDIVGIFDAEDQPDPDQITVIARRFQQAPKDVVCLQGVLDYYNPRQNWLARCFTIEYASWFRVMLPGMAQLGFAIPLGGTTLYFRRDVLEELGGWDAHNVTEDADLGFRLARHGYKTEMISTVTEEEANCRFWPWIKQRSRWLKGYMTTYLVHMRSPRQLYRQLGAWKFWGFQAHFMSALSQFVLAPFLWSFWLVLLGVWHPLEVLLPWGVLVAFGALFLLIEVINITINIAAVSGPRHSFLMKWAPTMHFYSPLGAIAAYKALYELVWKPFFWDKTAHGLSLGVVKVPERKDTSSDSALDLT